MQKPNLQFVKKNWKQNWAGGWAMLSSSYLAYQYTKQLKDELGVSLEETLLVSHDNFTSCYFIDEFKEKFGNYFADKAIQNPSIINEWTKKFRERTDIVLSVMKKQRLKPFSPQSFSEFIKALYEYGVYHRIVKVTVDYLPLGILDQSLDTLTAARVYAEPVYEEMENHYRFIAGQVSAKENIKLELVLSMTRSQFIKYLEGGQLPETVLLEEQNKNCVLYVLQGDERSFVGSELVLEIEKLLVEQVNSGVIKGQTGFSGKVKGRVRVILDPLEDKDFQKGDILVTGMTRPEYLSLIRKSAGFITDAGGILSHAAITARELKKTCVIGTQVATKVLKDGDFVEVNADTGMVTVLKRAN